MIDREDGGNLLVLPPREVWERSELSMEELTQWACLVSATGRAMLDTLPQLDGGCINYWDAGNWALNDAAEPRGRKRGDQYRRLHLHLLGRSPGSRDPAWQWGEAPVYCMYEDRFSWSSGRVLLSPSECADIIAAAESILTNRYRIGADPIHPWRRCKRCEYPAPLFHGEEMCEVCRAGTGA
jgi:hypothetical protein